MATADMAAMKLYLRIDGDEENSVLAECMAAADSYLESAVTGYAANIAASEPYAAKAAIVRKALVSEMFRNRDPSNDSREGLPYYIRSQLLQLECWAGGDAP